MASYQHGYEDERFENAVSRNFHCPICMNVFNDPVMCQRNQHFYCRPCITRHLENSQTCPTCMEKLTVDTLRQAPRLLSECLSELNIRCDYFSRGCCNFVQLEKLESHVKDCGFAPVICTNEGCLMEINKRDRAHHEAEVCELRKVKCHNCTEMTKMMAEMRLTLKAIKDKADSDERGIKEIKKSLAAVKDKLEEVDEFMRDRLKTLPDEIRSNKSNQDETVKEIRGAQQDATSGKPYIVVAGGYGEGRRTLNSSEKFNFTRSWSQLPPMKEYRSGASSFIFKNQITVTGGWNTGIFRTNSMEQINIEKGLDHSSQWHSFPAKLPGTFYGHKTIIYNERLLVIGGVENWDYSDSIHEVLLYPPYTTKLLATMPQPRAFHGAEPFNDRIVIFGGREHPLHQDQGHTVLMFDVNDGKCQQITSLPYSVNRMATVKWGDSVILLGGQDKEEKALNTVIIYNVTTGVSHTLPEMKCKRQDCAAVVSGNTIVVMGGLGEKDNVLKSVECFTFDRYSWEDLPPMTVQRGGHTALTL